MSKHAFFAFALLFATPSFADVIDDNVKKAEASLLRAQKKLEAARLCQENRVTCLAEMQDKAQKALERAQAKLAALNATTEAE